MRINSKNRFFVRNLVQEYLDRHNLKMSDFAKIMKVGASSVFHWKSKKMCPNPTTAWRMHRKTNGEIPITYWGYIIVNGKIKKIDEGYIHESRRD